MKKANMEADERESQLVANLSASRQDTLDSLRAMAEVEKRNQEEIQSLIKAHAEEVSVEQETLEP